MKYIPIILIFVISCESTTSNGGGIVSNGDKIALTRQGNVWIINTDGTNAKQLTKNLQYDRPLTWYPNGTRIIFWEHSRPHWDLWSVDINGQNLKNLTHWSNVESRSPSFSPDGRKIAFMSETIYIMNADGSGKKRLVDKNRCHRDIPPSWSTDGNKLAYNDWKNDSLAIFVINIDGSNDTFLIYGSNPQWFKDSQKIIFEGERNGKSVICSIDPDGKNEKILAFKEDSDFRHPVISPDGKKIACLQYIDKKVALYIIATSGEIVSKIVDVKETCYSFSWSPDSKRIVYSDVKGYNDCEIFIVDIESKKNNATNKRSGRFCRMAA